MIILYNPETGADVGNHPKVKIRLAGFTLEEPLLKGQMKQYPDAFANALKENYDFLEVLTPAQAEEIVKKPKMAFKCEFDDFATDTKIAYLGHMRKHKDEVAKAAEPVVDPSLIPVAAVKESAPEGSQYNVKDDGLEGADWYGEGVTEEHSQPIPSQGNAHFGGEPL